MLFLNVTEKLRRFLRRDAGGIWIKIHLSSNLVVCLANHLLTESNEPTTIHSLRTSPRRASCYLLYAASF